MHSLVKVDGYVEDATGMLSELSVPSDARLKENVETLDGALEAVAQLRGVSFDWIDKNRGEDREIGVIAQEVEAVFPEVVNTKADGFKAVEYSKLVAPLIEAVKELKAENETLKEELEVRTEALAAENDQLEKNYVDLQAENQALKIGIQDILTRLEALENR